MEKENNAVRKEEEEVVFTRENGGGSAQQELGCMLTHSFTCVVDNPRLFVFA